MLIEIKDVPWKIRVMSVKRFTKLHTGANRAVTVLYPEKEIHFNRVDFTKSVIRHELSHAFYNSCLTTDSELKKDQIEEVFAKIIERHYTEIGRLTNLIYKKFKHKKIKPKKEQIIRAIEV